MRYWLMKSEPDEVSIDDLAAAPKQTLPWFGVRNYLARNYMRDMKVGEQAFFYHSSCPEPGIAGICEVAELAFPDATQFDKKSPYYDPKATPEAPRWFNVAVKFKAKVPLITLPQLREQTALAEMVTLQRGNRLSITPVTPAEWRAVMKLAK